MSQWYCQRNDHVNGLNVLSGVLTLADVCCARIAKYICSEYISAEELKEVLDVIKHDQVTVQKIWNLMVFLKGDSLEKYLVFKSCIGFDTQAKRHYRYEAIPTRKSESFDIKPSILFLNKVPSLLGPNFDHIVVLDVQLQYDNLIHLPNLNCLGALSVEVHSSDADLRKIEDIGRLWKSTLTFGSNKWDKLVLLSLPQLKNPKVFYDIFDALPTLNVFEANIKPSLVSQIPLIANKFKYIDNREIAAKSLYEKYIALKYESENSCIDCDLKIHAKDILYEPIRKYEFKTAEKSIYNVDKASVFAYGRKIDVAMKRITKSGNNSRNSNKRPKIRKVNNISLTKFFGYKI